MNRLLPAIALALAVTLPLGAAARPKHSPAPAATGAAAPGAAAAADVTCAAGDPVVWINTETKVYHLPGSSYYGKTKHGKYACASDAAKLGDRPAKREGGPRRADAPTDAPSAAPAGAGTPMGKHHHKRRDHAAPSPTPS